MALKKPTPTQAVLLISAAGLGLSLPGVVLASRDPAPTRPALNFGLPAKSEQPCSPRDLDALASCHGLAGELRQTFVAQAMALPLPLAAVHGPAGLDLSFRASDADATQPASWPHEARIGPDGPEPGDDARRPERAAAAQVAEGSNREDGHEALVMVLLEHAPRAAGGTMASAALPGLSESTQRQTRVRAAAKEPHEPDRAALALAVPAAQWAAPEDNASSALTEARSPDAAAVQAADRYTGRSLVGTAESQPPSASVESVWASLAEVLGSSLDESAPATEASHAPVASRPSVTVASRAPAADVSAPPPNPPGGHSDLLQCLSEADDIVVAASHSDKVLLDLAALRSGVDAQAGSCGAHASKTIVLGHSDKVLQTLALFQSRKPSRAAFGCSQEPQDRAQAVAPAASAQTRAGIEPPASSASAAFAQEVDILLDLSPTAAHRSAQPLAQAERAPAAAPEAHSAGRANRRAIGSDMVAVSSQRLDEVRGGFVTESGLKVSFGIERAVYLNGSLVTTTSLNISDLSKIAGGQAQVTGAGSGSLALVQSGSGNAFSPGSISSTAAGTVIQNTLDNQKINTITRIDAVVNSASILRSINLQSSMRSAIVDSLRR